MIPTVRVAIAYAAPGVEAIVEVVVAAGATVIDAVDASGLGARFTPAGGTLQYAIFGQSAATHTPVRDGDRIELTRCLQVDPKDARRARARRILP